MLSSSKILLHQPKRLQTKIEDAYHVVESAGGDLIEYIRNNMYVYFRLRILHPFFFL